MLAVNIQGTSINPFLRDCPVIIVSAIKGVCFYGSFKHDKQAT